jgi:hypothetical protein
MAMAPTQEPKDETSKQRNERDYRLSKLPVFRESSEASIRQQTSEKLYGEICAGWRMLTDVRFKLLGLLPLASLAGGYGLFALHDQMAIEVLSLKVLISLFGLVVTIGLVIYEQRNDGLYNDLISRGRRIEYEWGVDTGLFLGRKVSGFANHSRGTWTVYSATLALWLGALVISLIPFVGTVRSWLAL